MDIGLLLAIAVMGGFLAGAIADSRGLGFGTYFMIGFLIPIVGVILALVATGPGKLAQLSPAQGQGWWPDPTGRFDRRYFDGRHWTKDVTRDAEQRQLEDPL